MSRRKKSGDLMKLFSFRVPPKMIEEYRIFCEENCMDISKRLRKYMQKDIENWKKIKISKIMAKKAKEEKERLDNQKSQDNIDDIDEKDLFD
tara:strand:- start:1561 stop:1836 length:276 start_codon:yes stop_codon:yes gene_type:complete